MVFYISDFPLLLYYKNGQLNYFLKTKVVNDTLSIDAQTQGNTSGQIDVPEIIGSPKSGTLKKYVLTYDPNNNVISIKDLSELSDFRNDYSSISFSSAISDSNSDISVIVARNVGTFTIDTSIDNNVNHELGTISLYNSSRVVTFDLGTDSLTFSRNDTLVGSDYNKNYSESLYGTDAYGGEIVLGEGLPRTVNMVDENGEIIKASNIERGQALRYGNVSQVRLEIRYGTDTQVFELKSVYVDYIKAPQNIRLTQKEIDLTEDTSQMLEYPDYVCQEIINELVHLVMENISDLRLQTHPVVTLSIANPAQQLTQTALQA